MIYDHNEDEDESGNGTNSVVRTFLFFVALLLFAVGGVLYFVITYDIRWNQLW
jgi:hypothetical protein